MTIIIFILLSFLSACSVTKNHILASNALFKADNLVIPGGSDYLANNTIESIAKTHYASEIIYKNDWVYLGTSKDKTLITELDSNSIYKTKKIYSYKDRKTVYDIASFPYINKTHYKYLIGYSFMDCKKDSYKPYMIYLYNKRGIRIGMYYYKPKWRKIISKSIVSLEYNYICNSMLLKNKTI